MTSNGKKDLYSLNVVKGIDYLMKVFSNCGPVSLMKDNSREYVCQDDLLLYCFEL